MGKEEILTVMNLISLNFIVDILIIFMSVFISYKSLKRYFKEPVNYENVFYWGFAFSLIALTYTVNLLGIIIGFSNYINKLIAFGIIFAWWMKLFALNLSIFCIHNCTYSGGKSSYCKVCLRKRARLIMWVILVSIVSIFILTWENPIMYAESSQVGINNLTGVYNFDLVANMFLVVLSMSILFLIRKGREYIYLRYAYILLLIGKVLRILNIWLLKYDVINKVSHSLYEVELALVVVGLFGIALYVYRLTKK